MRPFSYERASSTADALSRALRPGTAYLAGGTELINWMRLGIEEPTRVVDIGRLPDLEGVRRLPDGSLRIGALTTLNDAGQHPEVVRDYPVLSEAILKSASAQLRNLATGRRQSAAADALRLFPARRFGAVQQARSRLRLFGAARLERQAPKFSAGMTHASRRTRPIRRSRWLRSTLS